VLTIYIESYFFIVLNFIDDHVHAHELVLEVREGIDALVVNNFVFSLIILFFG
jgi:hypothetical protein